MATILKAAPVREQALKELEKKCNDLKALGTHPSMKVILVGDHPPSLIYTKNKKIFMERFGAKCEIVKLSDEIKEDEFRNEVQAITEDTSVHGCFIQLPLPKHLSHIDVGELIPPQKDVDGFSPTNLYALLQGDNGDNSLLPCTPKGIITMLKHYGIELQGKKAVVIGRSLIVGKPMALLLTNENATVSLCHSRTSDLKSYTKDADIIVSAVGKAKFLNKDFLGTNNPIIVDVGMNHDENGELCGDVDFSGVQNQCSAITPVPGGVGPMTILSLAQNLMQAAQMQQKK